MDNHRHGSHGQESIRQHFERGTEKEPPEAKKHLQHRENEHAGHHEMMVRDFRQRFIISTILSIPVLALSPLIQEFLGYRLILPGNEYILFALSTVIYFYGGWPFLTGMTRELRQRQPGMMTLVALAISVAFVYSTATVFGLRGMPFFWELATLIDIMLLGHWLEMRSIMGASRALEALARLMPSEAHLLKPDGAIEEIPVSNLVSGNTVLVKPGEKVPVDGTVTHGETSINESMLTGESNPVDKKQGNTVIGGSINGEGAIHVEVTHTGKDSYLSQVINLVREAQQSKSRTQDLANRAASWLVYTAVTVGTVTLVVWLSFGFAFVFALERMVTVMVIACPHALGLAVPLVVAVSTSISASNGLLVRNRAAFESARKINAVIFDKTGTLTEGKFGVTDIISFSSNLKEDDILKYAASVEVNSEHPIAQGIVDSSNKTMPVSNFKAITGKGAEGTVNGKDVKVVSPGYIREKDLNVDDKRIPELDSQGKTVVYVIIDGSVRGVIALADIIRPESKEAVSILKSMGINSIMLTGDNRHVAQWVAEEIGLDDFFAEVLPHEKAARVKEVQTRGMTVAMTGDGVNDAPALAQANVGVAIGAGTDVAVETADIILIRSNPLDVATIVLLSKATYRKMIENLIWATGYNIIAIPLAAGVLYGIGIVLSPAAGAVLMALSTIIVAFNASLLKIKKQDQPQ